MIPRKCKRLAEVDIPIVEVLRHVVREKSNRYGLPSILHVWRARGPLTESPRENRTLCLSSVRDAGANKASYEILPELRERAAKLVLDQQGETDSQGLAILSVSVVEGRMYVGDASQVGTSGGIRPPPELCREIRRVYDEHFQPYGVRCERSGASFCVKGSQWRAARQLD